MHVSESTVLRVLAAEGIALPGNPRRDPIPRAPWPDWLEWKPNHIWAYDFTHFTRARRAAIAILDMVSRKWLTTLVAAEESSTQVEVAFTAALDAEGMTEAAESWASPELLSLSRLVGPTASGLSGPTLHRGGVSRNAGRCNETRVHARAHSSRSFPGRGPRVGCRHPGGCLTPHRVQAHGAPAAGVAAGRSAS